MAKKSAKSGKKRRKCPHCRTGRESFNYLHRRFVYDVDRARELVSDGRQPVEVDETSVRLTLEGCRIHKEHLEHVDTNFPGIIAHVWDVTPEGDHVEGHVLIDGNHRATRCLQLGLPFFAYVLTSDESDDILKRKPQRSLCAATV